MSEMDGSEYFIGIGHEINRKKDEVNAVLNDFKELEDLSSLSLLINELASMMINAPAHSIDISIGVAIKMLGEEINSDRVSIYSFDHDLETMDNKFEWHSESAAPERMQMLKIPLESYPWLISKLSKGESIQFPLFDENDSAGNIELNMPINGMVASSLALPLIHSNTLSGFIEFDYFNSKREWNAETISLLRNAGEIIAGTIARKAYESSLLEAKNMAEAINKFKTIFTANMSHEIRTPINAILGYAELLKISVSDEISDEYVQGIIARGKTLITTINDMIELSSIEAGRVGIKYEPVNLRDILNDMKIAFMAKTRQKGLGFFINVDETLPKVLMADKVRLRQILFNLVENAIKFTKSGHVSVNVKAIGEKTAGSKIGLIFEIEDTGIGIAQDYCKAVFDIYSHKREYEDMKYDSSGLGLSISRKLAKMMNGDIYLKSSVGKGSIFTLLLRDVLVSSFDLSDEFFIDYSPDCVKFVDSKAMIIESNSLSTSVIREFLTPYGLDIIETTNVNEAIEFLQIVRPDIILLDMHLPDFDNSETSNLIQQIKELSLIPLIAIMDSDFEREGRILGELFDGILNKPVERNRLIEELIKHLPFIEIDEKKPKNAPVKRFDDSLCIELRSKFGKEYSRIISTFIIGEIDIFANSLKQFAETNNYSLLLEFSEGFVGEIKKLNITGIMECINSLNYVFARQEFNAVS